MSARCTCGYDGDPVVFGACRTCHPEPESVHADNIQSELDRVEGLASPPLVPSWRFVVPESEPAERPYETILDADERGDR